MNLAKCMRAKVAVRRSLDKNGRTWLLQHYLSALCLNCLVRKMFVRMRGLRTERSGVMRRTRAVWTVSSCRSWLRRTRTSTSTTRRPLGWVCRCSLLLVLLRTKCEAQLKKLGAADAPTFCLQMHKFSLTPVYMVLFVTA